jgi:hypothetical protein
MFLSHALLLCLASLLSGSMRGDDVALPVAWTLCGWKQVTRCDQYSTQAEMEKQTLIRKKKKKQEEEDKRTKCYLVKVRLGVVLREFLIGLHEIFWHTLKICWAQEEEVRCRITGVGAHKRLVWQQKKHVAVWLNMPIGSHLNIWLECNLWRRILTDQEVSDYRKNEQLALSETKLG